jgi:hypothetical protein
MALDSQISPSSATSTTRATIKYATRSGLLDGERGGGWRRREAFNSNLNTSGLPAIAYYDETSGGGDLRYAAWTGANWQITTVDGLKDSGGNEINVGQYPSLFIESANTSHISYYDVTNGNLKYATGSGCSWSIFTIDTTNDVGKFSSLALFSGGKAHIAYYDATYGDLKYATGSGSSWNVSLVHGTDDFGQFASLDLDASGYPHISYYDNTRADLWYAYLTASGWTLLNPDGVGEVGKYTSIEVDGSGMAFISY